MICVVGTFLTVREIPTHCNLNLHLIGWSHRVVLGSRQRYPFCGNILPRQRKTELPRLGNSSLWYAASPQFPGPLTNTPSRFVITADRSLAILCSGFGAIQLGSKAAFTDLVGSFIILTTVSYALAIGPHMLTGRKNVPRGPFWMGSAGYAINGITVLLIIFFNIMFCFRKSTPTRVSGDPC